MQASPVLAGRFFTKPPGKPNVCILILIVCPALSPRMNELPEVGSLVLVLCSQDSVSENVSGHQHCLDCSY